MGCAFEAAREQPKPRIKSAKRNQCDTTTTAIDTTTTTQRLTENLEIKDNYQQNHKTQTTTVKANTKQLKAAAQVLLTVQQQPQPQPKSQQLEQLQTLRQVALENKDALATHETIGARIDIKANSSDLQNSCHVNCHKRSEINRDEQQQQRRRCRRRHWRQDHTNRAAHSQERRSHSIVAATMVELPQCQQQLHEMLLHARAALMTSKQSSQQEAAAAASAAAEQSQQAENKLEQQQPLAYQHWRLKNVASAVVPATMSAAILANLSATSAAAYQYLGQHYKHYTQSFSFYAASSVILMLCYLTTTSTAAATQSETGALDKHPIFDESSSDKEILDLLLEKKRYDKRLLPPVNDEDFCCGLQSPDMATNQNARRPHHRGTLTVNVNVLLLSLASPDESSLKYEVEFLLNQQWNDPRLQYGNKSHYDFLNALHHHDSIWTPDTYFIMHGDFKDPIIPMHFALRIFRNGTITYAMRRHLILSCQGSLHIFPFDDPKCSFSMESISYEEAQIKYVWKNDEDTLRKSPSLTTLNAYLIKNQTTACDQNSWRGNYSCLQVELTFTRDRAYYFTTVFIPGIILVTSSFITFWLEWNAVPARVMIGVTTMLNFFTTSNGFRSTLPVVSNLTAMNVWDGVCMCFIYASLLEFVCVNYVGRKRPLHNVVYRPGENPVTQRLPAVLSRIGVILASPLPGEKRRDAGAPNEIVACTTCGGSNSPCTHSANNGCATETCFVQVRKKEPPHPIRVAKTIDVIARITFPTAYAIFLIFFFVHYKGFS
ncbi:glutamate-gated chloride channel isoform X16 [Drosophila busckii]|uniref:glutamate-gated chloride channel isoform X16 n=1 Tax=Drosophila busckii TaxID=30019 RepID=UPI00083EE9AE|nr:glutamate-gated chloride channel isoform X16 [Drosophila busckii]